jgi:type IV secretion system protein VirB1
MIPAAVLACAINVAPETMAAIIQHESAGDPIALNANIDGKPHRIPTVSVADAVAKARQLIAMGRRVSVDMGLAGLNSRNLDRFGYNVEDAFDPCKNVAAGGAILRGFYGKAVERYGDGQVALAAALSGYNTGDLSRGFANGYVARYFVSVPAPVASPQPAMAVRAPTTTTLAPENFHQASGVPASMPQTTVAYDRPGLNLTLDLR